MKNGWQLWLAFVFGMASFVTADLFADGGLIKNQESPHAKIRSVPLGAVQWTDGFWSDRFQQCETITLPQLWELADEWAWNNFQVAAGEKQGEVKGCFWEDAWVFKWIESACYLYSQTRDPQLLRKMDDIIEVVGKVQQSDGYLATQITLRDVDRFSNYRYHEVYTMGHLLTAACAHHRVTGKDNFLKIARRVGDFLYREYTTSDNPYLVNCPVNPSIIMGATELYRTTGDADYLKLANIVISNRGKKRDPVPRSEWGPQLGHSDLNQDRVPLFRAKEVVGHAVFWSYLYAGAADVYMESGEAAMLESLQRLWSDLVASKMYITGGVSPVHKGLSNRSYQQGSRVIMNDEVHEAAGLPYDLPSATAYNETCGQIGNLMWNWRMLAISGEARFAEVMEQSLYNSVLSGVNVSGKGWSYTNPLRWHGPDHELLSNDFHQRMEPGDKQICCPTNLMRTVAGWHGCVYGVSEDGLWLHHFAANKAQLDLPRGGRVDLAQETAYPWQGTIRLRLDKVVSQEPFRIHVRIPDWAKSPQIRINGDTADADVEPGAYCALSKTWASGDTIEVELGMEVRRMVAHPRLEQARNQVAVVRGPIVYCLESIDLPEGVAIEDVHLPRESNWTVRHDEALLGGVTVLETAALVVPGHDGSSALYQELKDQAPRKIQIRLIPYYAWNNRGEPSMSIWLPLY